MDAHINLLTPYNNDDTQALEALEKAAEAVIASNPLLVSEISEAFGMVTETETVTEWEWTDGDDIPFAPASRGLATQVQLGNPTPNRDDQVLDWLWDNAPKPAWV